MRIEDLKIFVDVARSHSMNTAAEKNFTTPQNLSKIIRRMEDEIGIVLFSRSKKGSILTEEGERYYKHIIEVLHHYNSAMLDIVQSEEISNFDVDDDVKIKVMCTCGALSCAVMEAYNSLNQNGQKIILEINEVNTDDMSKSIETIKSGNYDIIAYCVSQENVNFFLKNLVNYELMHIVFDEVVLVVSKNNPLSVKKRISSKDLIDIDLISFLGSDWFSNMAGGRIKYTMLTNSHSKAIEQISRSDSYGMLMFKKYCELNSYDFSVYGNLSMITLDWSVFGVYILAVNKERVHNHVTKRYLEMINDCLTKK